MRTIGVIVAACAAVLSAGPTEAAVQIQFDYSRDGGFFSTRPEARAALDYAGSLFEDRLLDPLHAIAPTGGDSWTARFYDPSTGGLASVSGLEVPEDTLVVYVGGRDLSGSLGMGGPGGAAASAGADWRSTVFTRGQSGAHTGATATDFAPWGGSIAFDTEADWHFGLDESGLASTGLLWDFLTVAVHELGHVLGIGTAPSWHALVESSGDDRWFTGSHAARVTGGPVPLDSYAGHWADGTTGHLLDTAGTNQQAAMTPYLPHNTRQLFTDLDWAAMVDVGWQVRGVPMPEPSSLLILAGLAATFGRPRRHAA